MTGQTGPNVLTTQEWLDLPLTVKDVDGLETWLEMRFGVRSDFPWPLVSKVLRVAREAAES